MAVPGYSLSTSSTATSGVDGSTGFNNSGFNVNFGGAGGVATGAAVPSYVWIALAGVAAWVLLRKH